MRQFEYSAQQKEEITQQKIARVAKMKARGAKLRSVQTFKRSHIENVKAGDWWEQEIYSTKDKRGN